MADGQTLAQMIRAKYPTQYNDMDDATLETNWLKKYPTQYNDIPRTQVAQPKPIQDTSTLSARPSLGSRLGSAFAQSGPTGLGEELGNTTREAIGGIPLPGVNKTLGQGLTDLGQMANMASTEASLLQAPQLGEGIVNLARGGLPALLTRLARAVRDPVTGKVQTPWETAINKVLPDPNAPTATPARPIPKGTNYGQFLEGQKAAAKTPAPQPPFAGATSSAAPTSNASLPGIQQGSPTPFPTVSRAGTNPAGVEPLIKTPEEYASEDALQKIAEQRAKQRGTQYAGGVRTAGANKKVNQLFPFPWSRP